MNTPLPTASIAIAVTNRRWRPTDGKPSRWISRWSTRRLCDLDGLRAQPDSAQLEAVRRELRSRPQRPDRTLDASTHPEPHDRPADAPLQDDREQVVGVLPLDL